MDNGIVITISDRDNNIWYNNNIFRKRSRNLIENINIINRNKIFRITQIKMGGIKI